MKKRVFAAVLWAYVTWYGCNILAVAAGLVLPGALLGLATGALVLALPVIRAQRAGSLSASASTVPVES